MKEAALLVLATVSDSESILPLLSPYLNQIVPCVMAELNSISPLVRSSSINVLSKFSDRPYVITLYLRFLLYVTKYNNVFIATFTISTLLSRGRQEAASHLSTTSY